MKTDITAYQFTETDHLICAAIATEWGVLYGEATRGHPAPSMSDLIDTATTILTNNCVHDPEIQNAIISVVFIKTLHHLRKLTKNN